ncbi:MAG: alpha/beta fold hydrolase [Leptolyngbya sp. SIO3F4]|nr:alpha/beta fold hydrolase [Leptolyngbya sp. SIO3F4]
MTIAVAPTIGNNWTWRDFTVYYVRAGEARTDRPSLLLVHGFGASTDHWTKNIAELQHDFEVWAIDLIGFGRSSKPSKGYSSNLWRDQLSDFIEQIIGRPAVIAGNSIGGYSCLLTAATRPQWVKGAVLLNGVGSFTDQLPAQEPSSFKKTVGELIKNIMLSPIPSWFVFQFVKKKSYIRKTLKQVYVNQAAVTEELVDNIYRPATESEAPAAFAALFKAPKGERVDVLLSQLGQPLLLLWGTKDPWMNCEERSELFRKYYSDIEEHFLEAGHCPHDDRPELVNPLIRDWVLNTVMA